MLPTERGENMGRRFSGSLAIDDIMRDPSLVEDLVRECDECDPTAPRHQQRENCTACGGTGEVPFAIVQIAKELIEARSQGTKKTRRLALD